jgi:hypothetical protein
MHYKCDYVKLYLWGILMLVRRFVKIFDFAKCIRLRVVVIGNDVFVNSVNV